MLYTICEYASNTLTTDHYNVQYRCPQSRRNHLHNSITRSCLYRDFVRTSFVSIFNTDI